MIKGREWGFGMETGEFSGCGAPSHVSQPRSAGKPGTGECGRAMHIRSCGRDEIDE